MTRRLWLLPVVLAMAAGLTLWLGGPWASDRDTPVNAAISAGTAREAGASGPGANAQGIESGVADRANRASRARRPDRLRVSVVARYPHDRDAFTQGLLWHGGKLYETTGQHGRSRLRRWDLETGEIEQETRLSPDLFGEGLALVEARAEAQAKAPLEPGGGLPSGALSDARTARGVGDELIWLTWKAGRAFRFGRDGFASRGEFAYDGEGWGLTFCNGELYRSDGSATLWRHDPETFAILGRLEVSREGVALRFLNELECTPRGILANIWQSDEIVRIDSLSGRVTATIDARGLLRADERRPERVLNGIAYRPETDTLLLTGKHWPWLFEVVFEDI